LTIRAENSKVAIYGQLKGKPEIK